MIQLSLARCRDRSSSHGVRIAPLLRAPTTLGTRHDSFTVPGVVSSTPASCFLTSSRLQPQPAGSRRRSADHIARRPPVPRPLPTTSDTRSPAMSVEGRLRSLDLRYERAFKTASALQVRVDALEKATAAAQKLTDAKVRALQREAALVHAVHDAAARARRTRILVGTMCGRDLWASEKAEVSSSSCTGLSLPISLRSDRSLPFRSEPRRTDTRSGLPPPTSRRPSVHHSQRDSHRACIICKCRASTPSA